MESSAPDSLRTREDPPSIQAALDRRRQPLSSVCSRPRSAPSRSARVSDGYLQPLGDADEVGERRCGHFFHDVPSVYLQRDLADPQLGGGLLVEKTAHYQRQHLAFSRRELEIALPQHGERGTLRSVLPVLRDRGWDCAVKKIGGAS